MVPTKSLLNRCKPLSMGDWSPFLGTNYSNVVNEKPLNFSGFFLF